MIQHSVLIRPPIENGDDKHRDGDNNLFHLDLLELKSPASAGRIIGIQQDCYLATIAIAVSKADCLNSAALPNRMLCVRRVSSTACPLAFRS